eukprot:10112649-Heterocapsa_arctica.AAC.1
MHISSTKIKAEEKANQTDKGNGKGGEADVQRRRGIKRRYTAEKEDAKPHHCLNHCIYDCRYTIYT